MKILVDNKQKCGVYKIKNLINNKCYIGSTTKLLKYRCITHRCHLRYNRHTNQHLQNAWNKYGENNFEFSIIELCQPNKCLDREQHYIDILNPEYNILQFSTGTFGYKHSDEAKKKISIAFSGKNHPAYSGEYVFYHPIEKYYIGGRVYFSKKYNLKLIRIHKLCNNVSNQYKKWICLGKHTTDFKYPDNIDEIYKNKLNANRPSFIFYHKKHGKFIGPINKFCNLFHFKHKDIAGLYRNKRFSANGWICFGKFTSQFIFPKNIDEIYNQRIEKNNYNKNLKKIQSSFIHNTGNFFVGSLLDFSQKYNLHLRCVIRLYNGGRKQYKGWKINKIDENKEME